jgi:hypothetical protein
VREEKRRSLHVAIGKSLQMVLLISFRNYGVSQSHGEILFFLDSGDEYREVNSVSFCRSPFASSIPTMTHIPSAPNAFLTNTHLMPSATRLLVLSRSRHWLSLSVPSRFHSCVFRRGDTDPSVLASDDVTIGHIVHVRIKGLLHLHSRVHSLRSTRICMR